MHFETHSKFDVQAAFFSGLLSSRLPDHDDAVLDQDLTHALLAAGIRIQLIREPIVADAW
jgi:hypothetical protein